MSDDRRDNGTPVFNSECGSSSGEERLPRRSLLKILGGAAGVAAVTHLGGLSGCGPRVPEPPPVAQLPLTALPEGERVRAMMGANPVEVVRTGDEVRARSLWCTHLGCEVKWNGERKKYFCPCHEGVYNAKGFPISGPPPRSLAELQVTIANGVATITESAPETPAS